MPRVIVVTRGDPPVATQEAIARAWASGAWAVEDMAASQLFISRSTRVPLASGSHFIRVLPLLLRARYAQ